MKTTSTIISLFAVVSALACCVGATAQNYPWETAPQTYIAHRSLHVDGVSVENSLKAIRAAALAGYKMVEMDPRRTEDDEIVVMHDPTVTRTCVYANGKKVKKNIKVEATPFETLRETYRLKDIDGKPGELIPTFEEMVKECAKCKIYPMVHHHPADLDRMIEILKQNVGENFVMFSADTTVLRRTRQAVPGCKIMYAITPKTKDSAIPFLETIGGGRVVSTMQLYILDEKFTSECRSRGIDVQASTADYVDLPSLMTGDWTYLLSNVRPLPIERSNVEIFSSIYTFPIEDIATNAEYSAGVYKFFDAGRIILNDLKTRTTGRDEIAMYDLSFTLQGACTITAPVQGTVRYERDNGRVDFSIVYSGVPLYLVIEAEKGCVISDLKITKAEVAGKVQ